MGRIAGLSGSTEIFVVGTSHSVASSRIRERMHVDVDDVYAALESLTGARDTISEAIPLSTCGRLELYGVTHDVDHAVGILTRLLAHRTGFERREVQRHTYVKREGAAVRHLLRVAAGLDSVIHGEAQILGQVRDVAHDPRARATAGPVLHRLFGHAIRAGKRVRSETEIGRGAASLASASLRMLQREIGGLTSISALVLGAGDTGALMARLLRKAGVGRLVIANRTLERARNIAHELGAEAIELDRIEEVVGGMRLVVGCVAVSEPLLMARTVRSTGLDTGPRYFLDLAHPRNFAADVAELPNVTVLDLEQVFTRVEEARQARKAHIPRAAELVEEEATSFEAWLRSRHTAAVVKAVRARVLEQAMAEADRRAAKVPAEQRAAMRRLARSVARSLLHHPTITLREADPTSDRGRALIDHASALFGVNARSDDPAGTA